ncbi:hypothetical protein IU421_14610 [Nocardia cyriacigeorgica]|uniref:hypothetical protein n=1 Tax=Nocardia cyriacigeorgica TaxID=135487 RepID=UPI0018950121|nr:hypothetical protein [Nocardia cyriacigeorgica]MBF6515502.1 hypothetical protein [Nocardia cyriacigeorgica]
MQAGYFRLNSSTGWTAFFLPLGSEIVHVENNGDPNAPDYEAVFRYTGEFVASSPGTIPPAPPQPVDKWLVKRGENHDDGLGALPIGRRIEIGVGAVGGGYHWFHRVGVTMVTITTDASGAYKFAEVPINSAVPTA